jgi:hypothetical protein
MSDASVPGAAHDGAMTRQIDHHHRRPTAEERRFLDAIVFWRGLYAERGPQDRQPIESLASVIGEAERRMKALRLGALV